MNELITLTLQIPNLTDKDMLFHFMDRLQNWAKKELERRQVKSIDEEITQDESLEDFKNERHDKVKGRNARHSPSSTTPTSWTTSGYGAKTTQRSECRPTK